MTPALDSINLLEKITEFREIFYLPDYRFITKGYYSGTVRNRYGQGKGEGHRTSLLPLSELVSLNFHMFSIPFRFGFFMKLLYIGMFN